MRKYICSLIFILIAFLLIPCQSYVYGNTGYYPVFDNRTEKDIENNEHPSYKKWCEETFEFGTYVYEAYKAIAFLKYIPEPRKTDFWQTPKETAESKEGDCEDGSILFLDYLTQSAQSQNDAEIIWGWTYKKNSYLWFAHVWCELTGRDGEKYIVEGFSKEWNGIMPINIMEKSESRIPTLKLTCLEFNKLSDSSFYEWNVQVDENEIQVFEGGYLIYGDGYLINSMILQQDSGIEIDIGLGEDVEIKKLLQKLHKLFVRRNIGE